MGAVRLSNGDIVLGEWTTGELRRYDRDGVFVWRAAGTGEGPGEHEFMSFVGSLAGDSVVTYDDGSVSELMDVPGAEQVISRGGRLSMAVLESIHLDAAGNLWVEPHSPHGAEMPPFEVYTPDYVRMYGLEK